MKIDFDAAAHRYHLDGQPVPSVTQILAPFYSFEHVTPETLEHKRQIGEALHFAIELDIQGDLDENTLHPAVAPYFRGWRKFVRETGFEPIYTELRVGSKKLRYAGTLDLAGRIERREVLIDAKTTAALHPAVGPQTAAYLQAVAEMDLLDPKARRYALRLTPEGTYTLDEFKDKTDIHIFTSLLSVRNWMAKHKLLENA